MMTLHEAFAALYHTLKSNGVHGQVRVLLQSEDIRAIGGARVLGGVEIGTDCRPPEDIKEQERAEVARLHGLAAEYAGYRKAVETLTAALLQRKEEAA